MNVSDEDRAKLVPAKPNRFVGDTDATLVQTIIHIPERKRETEIHRGGRAENLGTGVDVVK